MLITSKNTFIATAELMFDQTTEHHRLARLTYKIKRGKLSFPLILYINCIVNHYSGLQMEQFILSRFLFLLYIKSEKEVRVALENVKWKCSQAIFLQVVICGSESGLIINTVKEVTSLNEKQQKICNHDTCSQLLSSAVLLAQQHWPLCVICAERPCWVELWSVYRTLNMSLPLKWVLSIAAFDWMHVTLKGSKITPNVRNATALWVLFARLGGGDPSGTLC